MGTGNLDVRDLSPDERDSTISKAIDTLMKGEHLYLINDHDPQQLHSQLQSEQSHQYDWEYVQKGPDQWKVKITRR